MSNQPDTRIRTLLRVLLADDDATACATCLDELETYVSAQLAGRDYTIEQAETAAHLDACVACSQSYALLYNVRLAEAEARLPAPPVLPAPDLSFLPPRATEERTISDLPTLLRQAVQQVGARLQLTFTQPLLDLLQASAPRQELAFRDAQSEPLFMLELPAPTTVVERLTVAAYMEADTPGRCLVQVSVALPGKTWPTLGGVSVHLTARDTDRRTTTDPWGEASFEDITLLALPSLVVEVGA